MEENESQLHIDDRQKDLCFNIFIFQHIQLFAFPHFLFVFLDLEIRISKNEI